MQENTLWWVDAKTTEQFRMLEWQFNHFSNLLQLLADTAYIFVGDAFGLSSIFIINGFVFDDNVRVVGDLDRQLGHKSYLVKSSPVRLKKNEPFWGAFVKRSKAMRGEEP